MKNYKTFGLVYKQKNFQEADKLIWILSPSKGKITCIAKGIRKIKSRKSGHIDILNYNKFSLHEGRNIDILLETTCIDNFQNLKDKYTYFLFYITELIDKLTLENSEGKEILKLIYEVLKNSDETNFLKRLVSFELKLLKIIGFEPNLDNFLDSGEKLSENADIYYSQVEPGFVSESFHSNRVDKKVIKCQRFCLYKSWDEINALDVDTETLKNMWDINKIWIVNILDLKFKSLDFIKF